MDALKDMKSVVLREAAVTAHVDFYSYYVDLLGWHDNVIEVMCATDSTFDNSNFIVFELWETDHATPGTHSNSTQVAAANVRIENVAATTGVTTEIAATENEVTIDSTAEDNVLLRFRYTGTKRYIHIMGDVTSAGSNPNPVVSVVAHLVHGRTKPESTFSPTIGAVS